MATQKHTSRTIRYDRLFSAAGILLLCIILLIYGISRCSGTAQKQNDEKNTPDTVITNESQNPGKNYPRVSIETARVHTGHLILVNAEHPCQFNTEEIENGTSSDINFITIKSILDTKNVSVKPYTASDWVVGLDRSAALAMDSWFADFCQLTGHHDLRMISGYKPDSADHDFQTGRTLTIGIFPKTGSSYAYKPEGDYAWIAEHAAEYGFVLRYPEDKSDYFDDTITERQSATFRYVGLAAAAYMTEKNICLEEFLQEIRQYSINNLLVISNGTKSYKMYFVPADLDKETTSLPVPSKQAAYDVSGNNTDGFIVTVYE